MSYEHIRDLETEMEYLQFELNRHIDALKQSEGELERYRGAQAELNAIRLVEDRINELLDNLNLSPAGTMDKVILLVTAFRKTGVELEQYKQALQAIAEWANAYPADVFVQPDMERAHEVLEQHGISIDAMHGAWGRYLMLGVKKIAEEALATKVPGSTEGDSPTGEQSIRAYEGRK